MEGESYKVIGYRLGLSPETIKNHASAIYAKLGVSARSELQGRVIVADLIAQIDSLLVTSGDKA